MTHSLKTKLSLSYISISLVIIIIISLFCNITLNESFETYITNQHKEREIIIYNIISRNYDANNKIWNVNIIDEIGRSALEDGIIIKLKNIDNEYIWEEETSQYKDYEGSYIEREYIIKSKGETVGYLSIGHYESLHLTENDIDFITTLNQALAIIAVVAVIVALILGIYMSKRIGGSILHVINVIREIEKGNFKSRITKKYQAKEVREMVNTINSLAKVLEDQENLRNRLTSDIAHELRTPLTVLQSYIESMIDEVLEPTADSLKSCYDELRRIISIVEDLEKLAQIENDNLILKKTKFNLDELIKKIIKIFKLEFENKDISLKNECNAGEIYADKDKIAQVITNILSNALKYTKNGGLIEISAENVQGYSIIKIRDNGIGISEEDLPYIFNRFYRADQSRDRATGGSGIGLAIAKAIIQEHGGEIEVKSELYKGSKFKIKI